MSPLPEQHLWGGTFFLLLKEQCLDMLSSQVSCRLLQWLILGYGGSAH